jgi:hypothetical protein
MKGKFPAVFGYRCQFIDRLNSLLNALSKITQYVE